MSGGHAHTGGATARPSAPTERILTFAAIVCGALTLLGLVVLWPSDDRPRTDPAMLDADPVAARVQGVKLLPCSYDPLLECSVATISVVEGITSGEVFTFETPAGGSGKQLAAGDDVQVIATPTLDGSVAYSFYEYERATPMLWLALLFVTAILVLGRWRGLGALAGLAASLIVIVVFLLPSLLDGNAAVPVALVAASVIAYVALYLAHGFGPLTTVALLSTFAALVVTGVLSWIFVRLTNFTGYTDDATAFLDALSVPIDPRGILLAGIVIGSLGVLDDVTVTQVSAVAELRASRPHASTPELFRSGLRIGRDHISSTVNTLFLAYAGASLPLLLLFSEARQGLGSIVTRELVAVEVVRSLVGSIGLVSAVPISTWLAAQVLPAEPHDDPRDRHEHEPGHDAAGPA
ncbi:MAG: YibE/F family protein [Acidimicrobiales bacterium]|nr:YibE/F family protein [Acidimicrobiales bacterium]MCB9393717.1 YibE/F family protein [Acidimicrobiaceae bacterium]